MAASASNGQIAPQVAARLGTIEAVCRAAGWKVGARRAVQYGAQISVGDGGATASVSVYSGKKGVSVVVGGPPSSPLRAALTRLVGKGDAAPAPASGDRSGADAFGAGPWLGSDESGKGDYFGPLVVAAVFVAPEQEAALRAAGVRDSKLLDDATARRVAGAVRELCAARFSEQSLAPAVYNARYAALRQRGENLNHLLAELHARCIADVLALLPEFGAPPLVIVDQFADERLVRQELAALCAREQREPSRLLQAPRAEANVAVAAASILARDRFLTELASASAASGVELPKGGSKPEIIAAARRIVAAGGEPALGTVAKLHFATTKTVLQG